MFVSFGDVSTGRLFNRLRQNGVSVRTCLQRLVLVNGVVLNLFIIIFHLILVCSILLFRAVSGTSGTSINRTVVSSITILGNGIFNIFNSSLWYCGKAWR